MNNNARLKKHSMSNSELIIVEKNNLDIIIDLKYATKDNFIGRPIYISPILMLHINAYNCLKNAVEIAKNMGYKIKVFDGFRPYEAQKIMYDAFPGSDYVSDPDNGIATHTRGIAIDLTLTDSSGNELNMGTEFDSFEKAAHLVTYDLPSDVLKNRMMLVGIMRMAGFDHYKYEWWHFQLPDPKSYPKLKDNDAPVRIVYDN